MKTWVLESAVEIGAEVETVVVRHTEVVATTDV